MPKVEAPSNDDVGFGLNADVIFSLEDGFVCASWLGTVGSVRLGSYESVRASMEEFIAQCLIGERLVASKVCDK